MKPDAVIEATIRAKFAKSKINADKFKVHVQGGVATIEGKTDVIQHKGTATRMAKTGGAIAVNNHIQIGDAARQKAANNLEQGRRRVQVKRGDQRSETGRSLERIRSFAWAATPGERCESILFRRQPAVNPQPVGQPRGPR